MRAAKLLAVVAATGVGLVAVSSAGSRATAFDKKVAMIVAQGGLGDQSYNDLANAGLKRAEAKYGFRAQRVQSADIVSQGEQILRQAGQSGFDLVIEAYALRMSDTDVRRLTTGWRQFVGRVAPTVTIDPPAMM